MFKYFVLFSLVCLNACENAAQTPAREVGQSKKSETEVKVFKGENGWGYDIYVEGKKYIHQTTIPSIPGTLGFASKRDAKKVGALVMGKIEGNEMPPSVTPDELKALKVELRNESEVK